MGKFGYWILSDLFHCYFLGINKIIVLAVYFFTRPCFLVIGTELVMGEITCGICFSKSSWNREWVRVKRNKIFHI